MYIDAAELHVEVITEWLTTATADGEVTGTGTMGTVRVRGGVELKEARWTVVVR